MAKHLVSSAGWKARTVAIPNPSARAPMIKVPAMWPMVCCRTPAVQAWTGFPGSVIWTSPLSIGPRIFGNRWQRITQKGNRSTFCLLSCYRSGVSFACRRSLFVTDWRSGRVRLSSPSSTAFFKRRCTSSVRAGIAKSAGNSPPRRSKLTIA